MRIADNPGKAGKNGQFFGNALSVTAGDDYTNGGVCRMKLSNGIASLGIGGGRDRTSVDYHDVRGCSFGGGGATAVKQLAFEDGAIGLRGAAAKLFDVEGRHLKPAKTHRKIRRTFHRALRGSDESVAPDQASRKPSLHATRARAQRICTSRNRQSALTRIAGLP